MSAAAPIKRHSMLLTGMRRIDGQRINLMRPRGDWRYQRKNVKCKR